MKPPIMTLAPSGILATASSTETTFMIHSPSGWKPKNIRTPAPERRVDLHQATT